MQNIVACINVNVTITFKVERSVTQGCPLIFYLFVLVGEVLNGMMKVVEQLGDIKGISCCLRGK
jgi:hypothetical protein